MTEQTFTIKQIQEKAQSVLMRHDDEFVKIDSLIAALKKPKFAEGQVICTPGGSLIRYCEALADGFIGYRNLTLSEHGPAVRALRGCVEISIGRTIGTLTADLHKALAAFDEAIHD